MYNLNPTENSTIIKLLLVFQVKFNIIVKTISIAKLLFYIGSKLL